MNYGENGKLDFSKLWDLMDKKKLIKSDLRKYGLHSNTIAKLSKNENVTADVICHLCKILKCQPKDIMKYIPPEETK